MLYREVLDAQQGILRQCNRRTRCDRKMFAENFLCGDERLLGSLAKEDPSRVVVGGFSRGIREFSNSGTDFVESTSESLRLGTAQVWEDGTPSPLEEGG